MFLRRLLYKTAYLDDWSLLDSKIEKFIVKHESPNWFSLKDPAV